LVAKKYALPHRASMAKSSMDELIATRTTLIDRLKNWEDQSSWQDFFDTYWKLIYGVARKSSLTETEAQEVVQETMITVAKHMPNFKYDRKIGSFRGWLMKTTRWRITDQLRKRGRSIAQLPASEASTIGTSTIERIVDPAGLKLNELWDAEWEKNLIEAALARVKRRVDPQRYQIFDFYVNKAWTPEKVAATFGVPVAQVYLAKHRVTELIKKEVNRLETQIC
jgi:RNA polymerase sigma factor (sigma-70 family)